MDLTALFGSASTVISFVAFIAIVAWAWSSGRRRAFDDAANAPFALPDDATGVAAPRAPSGERQS